MKNIILLSSNCEAAGKSTLAKDLVKHGIVKYSYGFALNIKKLCFDIHEALSTQPLTQKEFYQDKKESKILNKHSPREFFCDFSFLLQKFYGDSVWGDTLCRQIIQWDKEDFSLVIDDWRRWLEAEPILSLEGFNTVTVYINKEGGGKNLPGSAAQFEGQIKPESCDLVVNMNKDFSNYQEVLDNIINFTNNRGTYV